MKPKIKVCGMKYGDNIKEVAALAPDYMGFIFYPKTKRYVGELDELLLKDLGDIKKVAVVVNTSVAEIEEKVKRYGFDYVQLHGDETAGFCKELKEKGIHIIKAFQVDDAFDFKLVDAYKPYCDFFLFDTKSKGYGGAGKSFNWEVLKRYDNEIPFFLSGGIGLENVEEIKKLKGLNIHALDINSRFEIEPALKDTDKIKEFIKLANYEIYC